MLQAEVLFADRYRLIKCIGRGGFAEVWLAEDNWTNLQIAIKVYAPGQGLDQDGLREFCEEIASVYDLNHANLLKPQHVDTWENMPYLIMAYCPAGSCVKRVGKMTEAELWKLIHDVAAGLAYLHEKDIVHQDIKPDNILIDTEGNYLITDFGISTRARSTLQKSVVGSSISHGSGTVAYMGPERFSRQPAPTKASDIWSFGAMAFELLEGIAPFGMLGGGMQKSGAEIPFINANVSDALKFTIFKMLSKGTWDRPTAATLVEWVKNPSAIEVDYDLITEEELTNPKKKYDNYDSHSVLDSPVMMAHPYVISRETQRQSAAVETKLNISVTPQEINVPAEGGWSVFSVRTNGGWKLQETTVPQWAMQRPTSLLHTFIMNIEANKTGKTRECSIRVLALNKSQQTYVDVKIKQPSLPKETMKEQARKKQMKAQNPAKENDGNKVNYLANKINNTFTNEGYNVKIKPRETLLSELKGEQGKYIRITKGGFFAGLFGFRNAIIVEIFINSDGETLAQVGCNYNVWPTLLIFAETLITISMLSVADEIGYGWVIVVVILFGLILIPAYIRTILENNDICKKARNIIYANK